MLKAKRKEDNPLYTVYVRMTVNRKSNFVSSKINLTKDQWDDKTLKVINHPAATQHNVAIFILYNQVLQIRKKL